MAAITQNNRLLKVDTPLGADILLLEELEGTEAVSELFRFELTLVADVEAGNHNKVTAEKLMGQGITVSITRADGQPRYLHGIVQRFSQGQVDRRFATYSATIVPTAWLLTLNTTSRIFTGKTIPDVLGQVFRDAGITPKFQLNGTYLPWDYCVQYRETDFAFVSRLMEEEGIWYYFKHENGSHQLVITDSPSNIEALPGPDTTYIDVSAEVEGEDTISRWEHNNELFTGKWVLRDHHLELPGKTLEGTTTAAKPFEASKKTVSYDFPGGHARRFNKTAERLDKVQSEGERLSKLRMEEAESAHTEIEGESAVRSFASGFKFKIGTRTLQKASGSYVLTSVQHTAQQTPSFLSSEDSSGTGYRNTFTCIPADKPLRPERTTPKPMIHGLQSAEVVSEASGEEIYPDKYGRVRVKFAWDLEQRYQCWVPVAQQRAGKQGGTIWIPRVGDEVMVAFLEGDPDAPVIVGSLYNANNMPPYVLPDNKTQSGIKTRSTKGGGTDTFNELRFEDLKDSEEIYLQAQRNLTTLVKADETRTVGANRTTTIQKDDKRINKEGSEVTIIEKGNIATKVKKAWVLEVEEENMEAVVRQGDFALTVETGSHNTTVQGDMVLEVSDGNVDTAVATGNVTLDVDTGNLTTKVAKGNVETKVDMGNFTLKVAMGQVTIEAMQGIELKVGSNSIKISMSGIEIKGMTAKIEGQVQTEIKGLMTKVDGSAMLQAKGAITMIG